MCRRDLSRLHNISCIKSDGHIPRPPNGVSNLFETKSRCLKKTSCVDGIYPVYTIYPTSNPLVISPALPMAFQIYLKQNPGVQKKTSCVDGRHPVYTIYPASNPLAISPAIRSLNRVFGESPPHRTKVMSPALRAVLPSLSRYSTT